jgi:hypothetical protein
MAARNPSDSLKNGTTGKTGVIVLGMHRSGTSALARVLNLLGCDLPKTPIEAAPSNEAGHWESLPIARLNDRILDSAGTNWWDWMPFNPGWYSSPKAAEFKKQALSLLDEEFGEAGLFVLKDPRICRFAPFWIDVLQSAGARPAVVMQIRNPLEVAESLSRRDGFHPALGQLLWLRNVLEAEAATRSTARYCTSYDILLHNWPGIASGSQEALNLSWPRLSLRTGSEIDAFLSGALRHHKKPAESVLGNALLSGWLRDTFAILDRWAENGEAGGDHSTLDRIRAELDAASPAFSKLISAGKYSSDKVAALESGLKEAKEKLTAAQAALEAKQAEIQSLQQTHQQQAQEAAASLAQSQKQAAESAQSLARFQEESAQLRAEAQSLRTDLDEARGKLSHLQSELAQRQAEVDDATRQLQEAQQQFAAELVAERERHSQEMEGHRQKLLEEQEQQVATLEAERSRHAEELADERERHSTDVEAERDRHVEALLAERERLDNTLKEQRASADRELEKVRRLKDDAERRVAQRFNEIAALTRLLSERERQAQIGDEKAAQLQAISRVLLNGSASRSLKSRMRSLLPAAIRLKKQKSQLSSAGIFDPEAYLQANPDVAEAGVDPLWHYLNHGIAEGRRLQPGNGEDA